MGSYILNVLIAFILAAYPIVSDAPKQVVTERAVVRVAEAAEFIIKPYKVWVTAYSSTPEETDDTPLITAKGTPVRHGIVATNLFPFGTLLKIPAFFGDEIFIVEDRMHSRKENFVDVWMPSKEEAINFGIHYTEILVLN
jgi:3D (Asp-Asp-Asp) domain-containing protein